MSPRRKGAQSAVEEHPAPAPSPAQAREGMPLSLLSSPPPGGSPSPVVPAQAEVAPDLSPPLSTNGFLATGPASSGASLAVASANANALALDEANLRADRLAHARVRERYEVFLPAFENFAATLPPPPIRQFLGVVPFVTGAGLGLYSFVSTQHRPEHPFARVGQAALGAALGGGFGWVLALAVAPIFDTISPRSRVPAAVPYSVVAEIVRRLGGWENVSPAKFDEICDSWTQWSREWNASSFSPGSAIQAATMAKSLISR
jgi:hypothetical protein